MNRKLRALSEFSVDSLGCSRHPPSPHPNAPPSFDVSSRDTHCKVAAERDSPQGGPTLSPHSSQVSTEGTLTQRSPKLSKQKQEGPESSLETGRL